MSTIENSSVGADAAARVKEFYELLGQGQGDDVAGFVEANFAEGATLARPESLPGGGLLSGAKVIAKFMRAAASAVAGLRLDSVHESTSSNETNVFANLALDLGGATTKAIEWWTFADGKVSSLQAYYWDTAALVAPAKH
jgi:hypothetical protein